MSGRYPRLSPIDLMMLRTETVAAPTHIGGICIVDAAPLRDARGTLDLELVQARLTQRVAAIPELRRIVWPVPPLCGRPLWVDDPRFSIERHVRTTAVAPPGDEAALLDTAERLLRPLMDRSKPLWELWVLTGLTGDRCALLFKVHHALADGLAAVRLIAALLDEGAMESSPLTTAMPQRVPRVWPLFADNLRSRAASRASRSRTSREQRPSLAHRLRSLQASTAYTLRELRQWNAAPQTSLNARVRPGRRLRVMHLDLETARAAAHAHGGTVNDVVLAVVAGGLAGLVHARRERVVGSEIVAAIGVNLRDAQSVGEAGNVVGALRVRLPLEARTPGGLLEIIAARTRAAKASQRVSRQSSNAVLGFVGWLAALGISFAEHQRMINVFVSNVRGPTGRLHALGARVHDVIPVVGLFGNETLSFIALSYCGTLDLVTVADRTAVPDVEAVVTAMQRTWDGLAVPLSSGAPTAALTGAGT